MGFAIVIALVIGTLAAIGIAIIYVGVMVMLSITAVLCLIIFFILSAVLGDQNTVWAIILALPIGIAIAFMLFNRGEHE